MEAENFKHTLRESVLDDIKKCGKDYLKQSNSEDPDDYEYLLTAAYVRMLKAGSIQFYWTDDVWDDVRENKSMTSERLVELRDMVWYFPRDLRDEACAIKVDKEKKSSTENVVT